MIGWYILAGICALILLLLLPVRFCFSFHEEPSLVMWVAFVPVRLLPNVEHPEKKGEEQEAPSKHKESGVGALLRDQGLSGVLHFIKSMADIAAKTVRRVGKRLVIERCELTIAVGGEDAAAAAVQYGRACALLCPAWTEFLLLFRGRRKQSLQIVPDLLSHRHRVNCSLRVRIRLLWLLRAAAGALTSYRTYQITRRKAEIRVGQGSDGS